MSLTAIKYHTTLADYFSRKPLYLDEAEKKPNTRKLVEQPWQLEQAEEWERLFFLLQNKDFFLNAFIRDNYEIRRFWASIEHKSEYRIKNAYLEFLKGPITDANCAFLVAELFNETSNYESALIIQKQLTEYCFHNGDEIGQAFSLTSQASILRTMGDPESALEMLKRAERVYRKNNRLDLLPDVLVIIAQIYREYGRVEDSYRILREMERICRKVFSIGGLTKSLYLQGLIEKDVGNFNQALNKFDEAKKLSLQKGDMDTTIQIIGSEAVIIRNKGDLSKALELHDQQEKYARQYNSRRQIARALGGKAVIKQMLKQYEDALKLHNMEEEICREIEDKSGLAICLANQSILWKLLNEHEKALRTIEETEKLWRELGNIGGLVIALMNKASFLLPNPEKNHEAYTVIKEAYQLATKHGFKREKENIESRFDMKHLQLN